QQPCGAELEDDEPEDVQHRDSGGAGEGSDFGMRGENLAAAFLVVFVCEADSDVRIQVSRGSLHVSLSSRSREQWRANSMGGATARMYLLSLMKHGSANEAFAVRTIHDPVPGTGQMRIAVEASGINFADILARRGSYPEAPKPPCVLGFEVVG